MKLIEQPPYLKYLPPYWLYCATQESTHKRPTYSQIMTFGFQFHSDQHLAISQYLANSYHIFFIQSLQNLANHTEKYKIKFRKLKWQGALMQISEFWNELDMPTLMMHLDALSSYIMTFFL